VAGGPGQRSKHHVQARRAPSPQEIARHEAKARVYDTPEGLRLNVSAIVVRCKICFSTFHDRQHRRAWPGLDRGLKLASISKEYPPGLFEETYLESEVLAAAAQPDNTEGIVLVDRRSRFTTERTCRELEVSAHVLET
jgi:hypothetical protein